MGDFTPHQRKIIDRYYSNRDTIMLSKLSDLVSELYLAEDDKKRDRLWARVATAMKNLKVPAQTAAHLLEKRSPEVLAAHVKDWMNSVR